MEIADLAAAEKYLELPLLELAHLADQVRSRNQESCFDLCTISNAKSGGCSENCAFCAQSDHHQTEIKSYPLKSKDELLKEAVRAQAHGAARFGIVTSGNRMTSQEVEKLVSALRLINKEVEIELCASLGELSETELKSLKDAGLVRYHHNLETSRKFFPRICTSHTYDDRLKTIIAAKAVGLTVCSGGIIGLGESWNDRIELALALRELDVDAVPLNFLMPIPGTPLAIREPLSGSDAVRTIALFRLVLPDKTIKVAAGRESILKDYQALAFMAGANGMLIGGYLTVQGREITEDHKLVEEVRRIWQK